jgi:DNA invertase Pin-like site-specific DNA recombinase
MTAKYARQSIDKKDSISVEFQIEECGKRLSQSEESLSATFVDKGYSGKDTKRPEFQRMMEHVREGLIKKVVVYKLDRISRSLSDFLKMQAEFENYGVEFVSCNDPYDTSTPHGRMMVSILMTFAQWERETIQARVKDSYYARGKLGYYIGGYPPFGFNKIDTYIEGKKTYRLEKIQEEADIVRNLYEQYASREMHLGELVRELNIQGIKTRKNGTWNTTGLRCTLSNVLYVKADESIYTYLHAKGIELTNSIDDFIGTNGMYRYGKKKFATIAPHEGIIDSGLWMSVQERLRMKEYHNPKAVGKTQSWLQGLVRCMGCGGSQYVSASTNNYGIEYKYFRCHARRSHTCVSERGMLRMDELEQKVEIQIFAELVKLRDKKASISKGQDPKINELKIERHKTYERIQDLLNQIEDGTVVAKYMNERIERLDVEIQSLDKEILQLEAKQRQLDIEIDVDSIISNWGNYSIEIKKKIAPIFVERIETNGKNIDIITG